MIVVCHSRVVAAHVIREGTSFHSGEGTKFKQALVYNMRVYPKNDHTGYNPLQNNRFAAIGNPTPFWVSLGTDMARLATDSIDSTDAVLQDAKGEAAPDTTDGVMYVITEVAQYSLKEMLGDAWNQGRLEVGDAFAALKDAP